MAQPMHTMDASLVALRTKAVQLVPIPQLRRNQAAFSSQRLDRLQRSALLHAGNRYLTVLAAFSPAILQP